MAAALALVLVACQSARSDDPMPAVRAPCQSSDCVTSASPPPPPTTLMLENRSAGRVDVVLRAAPMLRLDPRVVDGTLAVPIPNATFAEETRVTLDDQQTANLGNVVQIATRNDASQRPQELGGMIRLGEGASFLALGVGKVLIRLGEDGKPFLDPEDPKSTRLIPTERALAECAPGVLDAPFDDPPAQVVDGVMDKAARVTSVDRDAAGCRVLTIELSASTSVPLRTCVPDAAYPFDVGANIRVTTALVTGTGGAFVRFEDDAGNQLELDRIGFVQRIAAATFGNTPIALDEDVTCARTDAKCGDVEVPAHITAMIDGAAHRAVFGEALAGATADHAMFVLGASGHPVTNLGCPRSGYEKAGSAANAQGSAWIASFTRVTP